jgi:Protein of unknown function (DUF1559)
MTRRVLSGPPLRRGLVWGLAVLLGCAVLFGTRDGSDVAAKDEPAPKKTLPADLALIPGDSFAFVTIRVADLWNDEGTKGLRTDLAKEKPEEYKELIKSVSVPPAEIERLTFVITKTPGPNDAGPVVAILVATTKPYDLKKVLADLLPEAKEEKVKGKTYHVQKDSAAALHVIDATTFLMGGTETVQGVMDAAAKGGDSTLAPALALAAGKHQVVGAMRPAALLETIGNMIPPQVEAFKPLLEAQAAYGSIDLGKEAKLEARLVYSGESETKDAVTAAKGLIALIQTVLPMGEAELEKLPKGKVDTFKKLYKEFGTAIKDLPIEAKGKQVSAALTLKADVTTLSKGVFEFLVMARGAASEVSSTNNIKQMVLAMHNYASAMGDTFPPAAITDKDDKPLLSWRVAILPYVEQDQLYKQFHLDEPWDSDHNKKLLENMPKIYQMPSSDGKPPEKPNTTHYRVFHGKGAAFEGTKGMKLPGEFTDGTSNTILIVEAEDAVPWTKPDELPFDPKKDPPKLGLKGAEKFNAGFADGAVHVLSKKIDKDVLKALITRNGGETVTIPDQ